MLAILEFVLWLLILPYVLFGVFLGMLASAVARAFEPRLLLAAVWLGGLGLYLMPRRVPDDKPFVNVVDAIAQSHVFGMTTPMAMLAGASFLLLVAAVVAVGNARRSRT